MNEISNTINKLTGEGFVLVSTNRQIKSGTLIFDDLFQPDVQYGIYGESGYVRKRNKVDNFPNSRWYGYSGDRWWQLNETTQSKTNYGGICVDRILTPNQYEKMANTIIRVAKKSRVKQSK